MEAPEPEFPGSVDRWEGTPPDRSPAGISGNRTNGGCGPDSGPVIAGGRENGSLMNRWMKGAATLFAVLLLAGCSLLKVSVSTGDPLSKEQMETRTLTRGFYYDLSREVVRAADSIVAESPDLGVRVAAVRWKIRTTQAALTAAMQGIPDVALADLWILCRRMERFFTSAPDSLLFGPQSSIARETASRLDRRVERLARQTLSADRYPLMERFVARQLAEDPGTGEPGADNTTLAWLEYLHESGVEHAYATGSIAEVLADVNDRVSGQTQQLSNSVSWSKDIFEMRLAQDSLHLQLGAQLDSLERDFSRMVAVAEHLPELSDRLLAELNAQATQLISTMDTSVDQAFADLDRQRMSMQEYVSREREALVGQLRETGNELVRTTLDAVPGVIGKLLFYFVLAVVVLVGGPFALGFWLGGVRARSRIKKQKGE